MLNCIDNSGAAVVECVKVLKMKRHAKIGTTFHHTTVSTTQTDFLPSAYNRAKN